MTTKNNKDLLSALERDAGHRADFRSQSIKVGSVYTMNYSLATIAVYDYDREAAGGLPRGGFLIAAKQKGDSRFILLRILKEARLPNAITNDQIRQQGVESTSNENSWAEALDPWMRDRVSLHGIECRILGTFTADTNGDYKYAEDTDNYYAVHELMVWKPDQKTLELIVNYRHRHNAISITSGRSKIGQTRFAAAEGSNAARADVLLDPTDLLRRRTVYLGMSRSGKSNAMKITAERIYKMREKNKDYRVGQLIFDPNGEYAQDNEQDGKGLHKIHQALGLARAEEVETYGLYKPDSDPERTIMKINFFGDSFPITWGQEAVEQALDQMLAGRVIIQGIMSDETARYTTAFRDADINIPATVISSKGAQIRYRRAVLVYQTALAAADFEPPKWKPSVKELFSKEFIDALKTEQNQKSENQSVYNRAALVLGEAKSKHNGLIEWRALETVFSALNQFIYDKNSYYNAFEEEYIRTPSSGEHWADPRLKSLLRIFETSNGPRSFQRVREQHSPDTTADFAAKVVDDLRQGKLVIVDQSTGDPKQNLHAAERIMWKVFNTQQESFRASANSASEEQNKHILVYLEEAHNLLPRAGSNKDNNLRSVWARSAKEGSKMNIGMILATQAPSSIMPEILSETDNWILAYLNSENERRIIAGYMDFEDFLEQIGRVSEPGFVRLRTLSLAYTVPIQFDKFELRIPEESEEG